MRVCAPLVLLSALAVLAPRAGAETVLLERELARLAERHGFVVVGLEKTADAHAKADGDDLLARLRRLLDGFDHVILDGPNGVERVIVIGAKSRYVPPPPPPPDPAPATGTIVLQTRPQGSLSAVQATLEGIGGRRIERRLLVDTGADFVVLPLSLAAGLGLDRRALAARQIQTANGKVTAYLGVLPAVWLGGRRIAEVETAFLDDQRLGRHSLLGMSVLGRFRTTIDDEAGTLTLEGR